MYLWLLGIAVVAYVAWSFWKTHVHPAQVLVRQAANMNWVAAGVLKDEHGYRNVRLSRGLDEAVIWYKAGNLTLITPNHPTPFKDFLEVERWLTIEDKKSEDSESSVDEWKNRELALYFTTKPADTMWCNVTYKNAELIQNGFLEIWKKANLEKFHSTNELPKDVIEIICKVADRIGETNNIHPSIMIMLAHQYVDADQLIRQLNRVHWLAHMMDRSTCAPQPESYVDYIKAQYFSSEQ